MEANYAEGHGESLGFLRSSNLSDVFLMPQMRSMLGFRRSLVRRATSQANPPPPFSVASTNALAADLLSALDDTSNMTANLTGHLSPDSHVQDLSASLRHYLPKAESIESLRSTVSDVPDDLRDLIQSVDDHISDVDLDLQEELNCNDELRLPFGEEDMDTFDQEGSTLALESNGSTVSSFEGHVSTAAMALKSILDGSGPGQVEPRFLERRESVASYEESNLRDTIQEYLQMERPSVSLFFCLRTRG